MVRLESAVPSKYRLLKGRTVPAAFKVDIARLRQQAGVVSIALVLYYLVVLYSDYSWAHVDPASPLR